MSKIMLLKRVSEFNPNDYKEGDNFALFGGGCYKDRIVDLSERFDEESGALSKVLYDFGWGDIDLSNYTHFVKLENPEGEQP